MSKSPDDDFMKRRDAARQIINQSEGAGIADWSERRKWFEGVYESADGDAAAVPWADLEAKPELQAWLEKNAGDGRRAIDVACGLGDNAMALANSGWQTTAFDVSTHAIKWAKQRFAGKPIDFQNADLFDLPQDWIGQFDLVHEVYTIQSLPISMRAPCVPAIASLVAPGGQLIVNTRTRADGQNVSGPPWPLSTSEIAQFTKCGLSIEETYTYEVERPDRNIPHYFAVYRKN